MLLGRKSADISNIFVQYGQGATRTVNVTGGNGTQEAEFIDGLRFTVESEQAFTMNVDIINGVPQDSLPSNSEALSECEYLRLSNLRLTVQDSFAWVVNTSISTQTIMNAEMRVPCKFIFNPKCTACLSFIS